MGLLDPPSVPSRFNRSGLASALPAASAGLTGVTYRYTDVGSAIYSGRVDQCDGTQWVTIVPPSGTYAPTSRVGLTIDATVDSYGLLGVDYVNNVVYAYSDLAAYVVYKCSDSALKQWVPLHSFGATVTLERLFVTAAGTLLMVGSDNSAGYTWRSTDGGLTWTQVNTSATMHALGHNTCQTPDGNIYFGEYPGGAGPYTLNLWKSADDGQTWTAAHTWPNSGTGGAMLSRHIHAVKADPYVTNRIWVCMGDNDNQAFIGYSDDGGVTITPIASGDQTSRSVDLLFTATSVIWLMDSPNNTQQMFAWDRTSHARTVVLADAGNSGYFCGADSSGRFFWTTTYEAGSHQTGTRARIFTGRTDMSVPVQPVKSMPIIPGATGSQWHADGPTADGTIFLDIKNTISPRNVVRLMRARLIDGNTPEDQPLVPGYRPSTVNPSQLIMPTTSPVALSAYTTNSVTVSTANRLWCFRVCSGYDMALRWIRYRIGAGTGGGTTLTWYLMSSDPTLGTPYLVLCTAAHGAVAAANSDLQDDFDKHFYLLRGVDYWIGAQGANGSLGLLGADALGPLTASDAVFVDGLTNPLPADLTGTTFTRTNRHFAFILGNG